MLEISQQTNLLEQNSYRYSLQDIPDPNLYRDIYSYDTVPKVPFNHRRVPMNMPEEIWITDTSLRDGQQSVEPYTVDQVVNIYKLLNKLGGPYGIIRQTEMFVYSEKDREALRRCQELGLRFPEITTWIRASREDFKLVRDLGIRETGILVSCSNYHIFKKLKTFLNWHSPLLMKGQSPDICKGDFLMHIKSNTRRFAYGEYGKPP